ncbi:MAG: allantoinase AllB [Planctomycetes bacterium]|nr:allantoinase AllB [Planctomycetota bacterium]
MPQRHAFSIASTRVVLPGGERPATIHIRDGLIDSVAPGVDSAAESLGDRVILPGLIDPHVHINEPGRTEWEGFVTATRAAAAAGITLVADMPLNSSPVTTTPGNLAAKISASNGKLAIDVAFHAGLVPGNVGELPALLDAGVVGVKAFLCHSGLDEFPNATRSDLEAAMPLLAARHVPLLTHAEIVHELPPMDDPHRYADYLATRPRSFEHDAIAMMIDLCRATGARVHIVHLADTDSLSMFADARREGLPITVETCPHYLYFDPAAIPDGATQYKCAPPIRGDGFRLLAALHDGRIDLVASDHSPCPPAMKETGGRFDKAWGGIASLQLGPSIVRSLGGVTPMDLARWMSAAPAKLLGVSGSRGSIDPGKRADLCIMDWDAKWTVDPAKLHHRHPITPYAGCALTGVIERTYLGGLCVYRHGRFAEELHGKVVWRE